MFYFIVFYDWSIVLHVVANQKEKLGQKVWEEHISDKIDSRYLADHDQKLVKKHIAEENYWDAVVYYLETHYTSCKYNYFNGTIDHVINDS